MSEKSIELLVAKYCATEPSITLLSGYLELKGERELATVGAHVLTNYRLLLVVDGQPFNIPLCDLKDYSLVSGPLRLTWADGDQERTLSVTGTVIKDSLVIAAMREKEWTDQWDEEDSIEAMALAKKKRERLLNKHPELTLPFLPVVDKATSGPLKRLKNIRGTVLLASFSVFFFVCCCCCCGLGSGDDSTGEAYSTCDLQCFVATKEGGGQGVLDMCLCNCKKTYPKSYKSSKYSKNSARIDNMFCPD